MNTNYNSQKIKIELKKRIQFVAEKMQFKLVAGFLSFLIIQFSPSEHFTGHLQNNGKTS